MQSQTRGREEISIFGERQRMREMRVRECERTERACLCCVSRHLCVRAHHGNCEGRRRWGWPAPTPPLSPRRLPDTQTFANARLHFIRPAHLKPLETGAKPPAAIAVSFFIAPACDATRLVFAVRRARCKAGPLAQDSGFQMRSFVCSVVTTNKSSPAMN